MITSIFTDEFLLLMDSPIIYAPEGSGAHAEADGRSWGTAPFSGIGKEGSINVNINISLSRIPFCQDVFRLSVCFLLLKYCLF